MDIVFIKFSILIPIIKEMPGYCSTTHQGKFFNCCCSSKTVQDKPNENFRFHLNYFNSVDLVKELIKKINSRYLFEPSLLILSNIIKIFYKIPFYK